MSDEKFKGKYRIKSARASWHDYNGGAYFITICTKNRVHYFGENDLGAGGDGEETGMHDINILRIE